MVSEISSHSALVPKTGNPVIVIRNGTSTASDYTLDLSRFSALGSTAKIYRFALPGSLVSRPDVAVTDMRLTISTPARTITTCVIPDAVSVDCVPTEITSHVQINTAAWQQATSAVVNEGATLKMGPHPATGGVWSWSGPGDFSAVTREITITDITTAQAGDYTATYTNPDGCKSTAVVNVKVDPSVSIDIPTGVSVNHQAVFRGNRLIITADKGRTVTVSVFDLRGVTVYKKLFSGSASIQMSSLVSKGNYLLKVTGASDEMLLCRRISVWGGLY